MLTCLSEDCGGVASVRKRRSRELASAAQLLQASGRKGRSSERFCDSQQNAAARCCRGVAYGNPPLRTEQCRGAGLQIGAQVPLRCALNGGGRLRNIAIAALLFAITIPLFAQDPHAEHMQQTTTATTTAAPAPATALQPMPAGQPAAWAKAALEK